jgi:protein transport protein SEC24
MLVVSDIDDVYLPKPTDLLVNLTEARPAIESVLTRLSDMFRDSSTTGSALGPAMQTAHKLIVSWSVGFRAVVADRGANEGYICDDNCRERLEARLSR